LPFQTFFSALLVPSTFCQANVKYKPPDHRSRFSGKANAAPAFWSKLPGIPSGFPGNQSEAIASSAAADFFGTLFKLTEKFTPPWKQQNHANFGSWCEG